MKKSKIPTPIQRASSSKKPEDEAPKDAPAVVSRRMPEEKDESRVEAGDSKAKPKKKKSADKKKVKKAKKVKKSKEETSSLAKDDDLIKDESKTVGAKMEDLRHSSPHESRARKNSLAIISEENKVPQSVQTQVHVVSENITPDNLLSKARVRSRKSSLDRPSKSDSQVHENVTSIVSENITPDNLLSKARPRSRKSSLDAPSKSDSQVHENVTSIVSENITPDNLLLKARVRSRKSSLDTPSKSDSQVHENITPDNLSSKARVRSRKNSLDPLSKSNPLEAASDTSVIEVGKVVQESTDQGPKSKKSKLRRKSEAKHQNKTPTTDAPVYTKSRRREDSTEKTSNTEAIQNSDPQNMNDDKIILPKSPSRKSSTEESQSLLPRLPGSRSNSFFTLNDKEPENTKSPLTSIVKSRRSSLIIPQNSNSQHPDKCPSRKCSFEVENDTTINEPEVSSPPLQRRVSRRGSIIETLQRFLGSNTSSDHQNDEKEDISSHSTDPKLDEKHQDESKTINEETPSKFEPPMMTPKSRRSSVQQLLTRIISTKQTSDPCAVCLNEEIIPNENGLSSPMDLQGKSDPEVKCNVCQKLPYENDLESVPIRRISIDLRSPTKALSRRNSIKVETLKDTKDSDESLVIPDNTSTPPSNGRSVQKLTVISRRCSLKVSDASTNQNSSKARSKSFEFPNKDQMSPPLETNLHFHKNQDDTTKLKSVQYEVQQSLNKASNKHEKVELLQLLLKSLTNEKAEEGATLSQPSTIEEEVLLIAEKEKDNVAEEIPEIECKMMTMNEDEADEEDPKESDKSLHSYTESTSQSSSMESEDTSEDTEDDTDSLIPDEEDISYRTNVEELITEDSARDDEIETMKPIDVEVLETSNDDKLKNEIKVPTPHIDAEITENISDGDLAQTKKKVDDIKSRMELEVLETTECGNEEDIIKPKKEIEKSSIEFEVLETTNLMESKKEEVVEKALSEGNSDSSEASPPPQRRVSRRSSIIETFKMWLGSNTSPDHQNDEKEDDNNSSPSTEPKLDEDKSTEDSLLKDPSDAEEMSSDSETDYSSSSEGNLSVNEEKTSSSSEESSDDSVSQAEDSLEHDISFSMEKAMESIQTLKFLEKRLSVDLESMKHLKPSSNEVDEMGDIDVPMKDEIYDRRLSSIENMLDNNIKTDEVNIEKDSQNIEKVKIDFFLADEEVYETKEESEIPNEMEPKADPIDHDIKTDIEPCQPTELVEQPSVKEDETKKALDKILHLMEKLTRRSSLMKEDAQTRRKSYAKSESSSNNVSVGPSRRSSQTSSRLERRKSSKVIEIEWKLSQGREILESERRRSSGTMSLEANDDSIFNKTELPEKTIEAPDIEIPDSSSSTKDNVIDPAQKQFLGTEALSNIELKGTSSDVEEQNLPESEQSQIESKEVQKLSTTEDDLKYTDDTICIPRKESVASDRSNTHMECLDKPLEDRENDFKMIKSANDPSQESQKDIAKEVEVALENIMEMKSTMAKMMALLEKASLDEKKSPNDTDSVRSLISQISLYSDMVQDIMPVIMEKENEILSAEGTVLSPEERQSSSPSSQFLDEESQMEMEEVCVEPHVILGDEKVHKDELMDEKIKYFNSMCRSSPFVNFDEDADVRCKVNTSAGVSEDSLLPVSKQRQVFEREAMKAMFEEVSLQKQTQGKVSDSEFAPWVLPKQVCALSENLIHNPFIYNDPIHKRTMSAFDLNKSCDMQLIPCHHGVSCSLCINQLTTSEGPPNEISRSSQNVSTSPPVVVIKVQDAGSQTLEDEFENGILYDDYARSSDDKNPGESPDIQSPMEEESNMAALQKGAGRVDEDSCEEERDNNNPPIDLDVHISNSCQNIDKEIHLTPNLPRRYSESNLKNSLFKLSVSMDDLDNRDSLTISFEGTNINICSSSQLLAKSNIDINNSESGTHLTLRPHFKKSLSSIFSCSNEELGSAESPQEGSLLEETSPKESETDEDPDSSSETVIEMSQAKPEFPKEKFELDLPPSKLYYFDEDALNASPGVEREDSEGSCGSSSYPNPLSPSEIDEERADHEGASNETLSSLLDSVRISANKFEIDDRDFQDDEDNEQHEDFDEEEGFEEQEENASGSEEGQIIGKYTRLNRRPIVSRPRKFLRFSSQVGANREQHMDSSTKESKLFKILFIGSSSAGKTSIIRRYVKHTFTPTYRATIGADFLSKVVEWDEAISLRLQLWDIAGQDRFSLLSRSFYKDAVGAFIVCDITRSETLNACVSWKEELDEKVRNANGGNIPCFLLANKCDLVEDSTVQSKLYSKISQQHSFNGWIQTSAKEDINITQAIEMLLRQIIKQDVDSTPLATDHESLVLQQDGKKRKRAGCLC